VTKADIETMLSNLAATTRDLHDGGRELRLAADHMRAATDHIIAVSDRLEEVSARTSAAITAGLRALHEDGKL
jgi:chemotaxis regulatin CheY-phosphate phosphatase CheZ